jgi:hypothetical protein
LRAPYSSQSRNGLTLGGVFWSLGALWEVAENEEVRSSRELRGRVFFPRANQEALLKKRKKLTFLWNLEMLNTSRLCLSLRPTLENDLEIPFHLA